jgi:DNA-directed RNA polymerase specialized sigma24 family protein
MKKYTDQEIIQGIKSGESYAVKYLAKDYLPVIRYYISKNNGNEEDAKDIFQDALFIIIEKIHNDDFALQGPLSTYLFAICKNLWLMVLDKQKAAKNYELRRSACHSDNDFSEAGDRVFYENRRKYLKCTGWIFRLARSQKSWVTVMDMSGKRKVNV